MAETEDLETQKESLISDKRRLSEKRRILREKLKTVSNKVRKLRVERDNFTKIVQSNKRERAKSDSEIKKLSTEISELTKKQVGIPGSTATVEKEYRELDWKYQTQSHSPADDRRLSQQLADLLEKLKQLKQRDQVRKQLHQKEQTLANLKNEQKIFHASVMANARHSQAKHDELLELYAVSDELKRQLEKVNSKSQEINKKLDAIRDQLPFRKRKNMEKTIVLESSKDRKIMEKKVREVKEKLRAGGKLTTDDLRVIQEANLEI